MTPALVLVALALVLVSVGRALRGAADFLRRVWAACDLLEAFAAEAPRLRPDQAV